MGSRPEVVICMLSSLDGLTMLGCWRGWGSPFPSAHGDSSNPAQSLNLDDSTSMLSQVVSEPRLKDVLVAAVAVHGGALCCFELAASKAAAAAAASRKGGWKGHRGAVSGIGVDAVNQHMVTAGVDGLLVFWRFKERVANGAVAVGSGVSRLEMVSDAHDC